MVLDRDGADEAKDASNSARTPLVWAKHRSILTISGASRIPCSIGPAGSTAVDADSGQWRWRAKTNYPIQSGMTPTAGGVVFFGDMGGNFYALDADDGHELWGQKIGGAVGGGVITYKAGDAQRVAVATGLTEVLWPTEITTAKVSILGLAAPPP